MDTLHVYLTRLWLENSQKHQTKTIYNSNGTDKYCMTYLGRAVINIHTFMSSNLVIQRHYTALSHVSNTFILCEVQKIMTSTHTFVLFNENTTDYQKWFKNMCSYQNYSKVCIENLNLILRSTETVLARSVTVFRRTFDSMYHELFDGTHPGLWTFVNKLDQYLLDAIRKLYVYRQIF